MDVAAERFPSAIEATAYFVVAEALTNVVSMRGRHAQVTASVDAGVFDVEVRDDGVGGAAPDGDGLVGLGRSRRGARRPACEIHSPPGHGTLVAATPPLAV